MLYKNTNISWLYELKSTIPRFLEKLKGEKRSGFFHYSFSGDLYSEDVKWGLGNTVFAIKIYHILNLLDKLPKKDANEMINFIKSFQRNDGSFNDPLIRRKTLLKNIITAFRIAKFDNVFGQKTIRAETKQTIAALNLLIEPEIAYKKIPSTEEEVNRYLNRLNWAKPWDAGSHFNHLIFFLNLNKKVHTIQNDVADYLINYAIDWVNNLQSSKDGSWYRGKKTSLSQKINGAMKVIRGLNTANNPSFKYPEKLIDLCLQINDLSHACNITNVIYVLRYANELTRGNYRFRDIQEFCNRWLNICKKHFFPDIGGFSFYFGKSNEIYYGARITRGLNEPDIHGTVMLLWGITLVSKIFEHDLGYNEPVIH